MPRLLIQPSADNYINYFQFLAIMTNDVYEDILKIFLCGHVFHFFIAVVVTVLCLRQSLTMPCTSDCPGTMVDQASRLLPPEC